MARLRYITATLFLGLLPFACAEADIGQKASNDHDRAISGTATERSLPQPEPEEKRAGEPSKKNPCSFSVSYRIGEIDPRFNLTEERVASVMERVAALWSGAADELLVKNRTEESIVIQFVYDERQAVADGESALQTQLMESESEIDALNRAYEQQLAEFNSRSESHRRLSEEILERAARLNQWIEERNESGGIGEQELEYYERERSAVESLQQQELAQRTELTRMADRVNEKMDLLNRKIDDNNRLADRYNREFAGGSRFTSGSYEWQGDRRTITVYHFRNERELELVLAHELGHAMGIGHVTNPRSVMYETMSEQLLSERLQLSIQDRQALRERCAEP